MLTRNQHISNLASDLFHLDADGPVKRVALLLAGGDGMRLRELTSQITGIPMPKQYCRLLYGTSLLEAAVSRARLLFPPDHINVIINRNHLDFAKDQVRSIPESNILVQPMNRDTGPGLVFSLLHLERAYRDATVAVFPTDHYIDKNWRFIAHVMRAMNAISLLPDKVAVLGVVPDRPEAGYGYILPSHSLKTALKTYHVEAFREKPSLAEAQNIIARGGLWNTFVMVFRLSRMLELVRETFPEEVDALSDAGKGPQIAMELYQNMHPWNFSRELLARIPQHLIVLKVENLSWSDWGTRQSVERTFRALNLVPSWNLLRENESRIQAEEQVRKIS
jgi:mannose-1-phosphate guanylyltransferase